LRRETIAEKPVRAESRQCLLAVVISCTPGLAARVIFLRKLNDKDDCPGLKAIQLSEDQTAIHFNA
jgi:hypothetical protein